MLIFLINLCSQLIPTFKLAVKTQILKKFGQWYLKKLMLSCMEVTKISMEDLSKMHCKI